MFSINDVEQSKEFGQSLPAGIFRFTVLGVELKKTKAGTGSYFEFSLSVVAPTFYKDSKLQHRTTFKNTNPKAEKIGKEQLADLIYCFQVTGFNTPEDLNNQVRGRDFVGETELEQDASGRQFPRIINTWSLGGKHRNPSRAMEGEPKLGETNRAPVIKKGGGGDTHPYAPGGIDSERAPF